MALSWKMLYGMFWRDANGHHNPPLHNGPGYVSRKAGAELGPVPTMPEGSKRSPVTQEFLINRKTGDMIPVVPGTDTPLMDSYNAARVNGVPIMSDYMLNKLRSQGQLDNLTEGVHYVREDKLSPERARTLKDALREIEESKTWVADQMRDDLNEERAAELINDLRDLGEKVRTGAGNSMPIVLPPSKSMESVQAAYDMRLLWLAFKSIEAGDMDEARTWIKRLPAGSAERMYRAMNVMMAELLAKDAADALKNYKTKE
jgi:hypothetical protein